MATEIEKIAQRELEIAKAVEALKREAEELAIARRVLSGLSGKPSAGIARETVSREGNPRPNGVPTTFEMASDVLAQAEKAGKDGLTGKELVGGIRNKYWPGLKSSQVLPTIYGFVNSGRLHKTTGGKFKRLKKAE